MYSEKITPKIDRLFDNLRSSVLDAIDCSPTRNDAVEAITRIVVSETSSRSKTMLSDLISSLSNDVLSRYTSTKEQNTFYEANLQKEIFDKYDFSTSIGKMEYKEINKVKVASCVAGGAVVGSAIGIGIYAHLSSALLSSLVVPIVSLVAASIGAFFASLLVTGKINKSRFQKAVIDYLDTIKKDFIVWFDTVENYFNKRVEEIMK